MTARLARLASDCSSRTANWREQAIFGPVLGLDGERQGGGKVLPVDFQRLVIHLRQRVVAGQAVGHRGFGGTGDQRAGASAADSSAKISLPFESGSCAGAGGKAPEDMEPFLPWNLSEERRAKLGTPTAAPPASDTS